MRNNSCRRSHRKSPYSSSIHHDTCRCFNFPLVRSIHFFHHNQGTLLKLRICIYFTFNEKKKGRSSSSSNSGSSIKCSRLYFLADL